MLSDWATSPGCETSAAAASAALKALSTSLRSGSGAFRSEVISQIVPSTTIPVSSQCSVPKACPVSVFGALMGSNAASPTVMAASTTL